MDPIPANPAEGPITTSDVGGSDPVPIDASIAAAEVIERAGEVVAVCSGAVGFIRAAALLLGAGGTPPGASTIVAAVLTVALALLAGWVVGCILRGIGAVLRALAGQAEAAARIERQVAAGFDRVAAALKSGPLPSGGTGSEDRIRRLAQIRQALRTADWDGADALVRAFADDHPDDQETRRLVTEQTDARRAAAQDLIERIDAAREANDPDRVIDLRTAVKPLLDHDALRALDRDLAKWLMAVLFRRSRAGTVREDVARLASKVAEGFDDTPEGASIRASLPTLRRAAGLCARCGQPYTGIESVCPRCSASAAPGLPQATEAAPSEASASPENSAQTDQESPDD